MSHANRNTKSATPTSRKPCCKVCKDAGKTEAEFSSHWPKDAAGNTICPTLLEQDCRYCGEAGHTVKYCKRLEKDNAAKDKARRISDKQKRVGESKPQPSNSVSVSVGQPSRFALLLEDSDSDESPRAQKKAPVQLKEEFPALGGTWTRRPAVAPVARVSFAEMACKPAEEALAEKQFRDEERLAQAIRTSYVTLTRESKPLSEKDRAAAIHRDECFKGLNGKGWADASDDSDEDEDDDDEAIRRYTDVDCVEDMW